MRGGVPVGPRATRSVGPSARATSATTPKPKKTNYAARSGHFITRGRQQRPSLMEYFNLRTTPASAPAPTPAPTPASTHAPTNPKQQRINENKLFLPKQTVNISDRHKELMKQRVQNLTKNDTALLKKNTIKQLEKRSREAPS